MRLDVKTLARLVLRARGGRKERGTRELRRLLHQADQRGSILRHADRVKIACLAQLVNTIATIRADPGQPAWRQTPFYPFSLTSRYARGEALVTRVVTDSVDTDKYGSIDAIDAIATVDTEGREATVFVVNRSAIDATRVTLDLRGFPAFEVLEHVVLAADDPLATNTAEAPERVVPARVDGWTADGSTVTVHVPAVSWNMVRLRLA